MGPTPNRGHITQLTTITHLLVNKKESELQQSEVLKSQLKYSFTSSHEKQYSVLVCCCCFFNILLI